MADFDSGKSRLSDINIVFTFSLVISKLKYLIEISILLLASPTVAHRVQPFLHFFNGVMKAIILKLMQELVSAFMHGSFNFISLFLQRMSGSKFTALTQGLL